MDVPDHVLELRRDILEREGGRKDDVEFTFIKGRWNHLGEATLMNRIKSHPDVGEKFYPQMLEQIRHEQAQEAAAKLQPGENATTLSAMKQLGKAIPAH